MKFGKLITVGIALFMGIVIGILVSDRKVSNEGPALLADRKRSPITSDKNEVLDSKVVKKPAAPHRNDAYNGQFEVPDAYNGQFEVPDESQTRTAVYNQAAGTVGDLRQIVMDQPASAEKDAKIQSMLQSLLDNASKNKMALNGLVEDFVSDPASETGQYLKSVLTEIKDPEVEAMAQDMVQSGNNDNMMLGLDLLGDLGMANRKTFDITSRILDQPDETSPEILMRAIYAMPVMNLPAHETSMIIDQLERLASNHPHEGVRSNSLFKIAKWAKDSQDLEPVIQALDTNRSVDDRISAVIAISQSNVVEDDLRDILLSRMTDEKELWEIRRYAAESLVRFKLTDSDYQQYEAFKQEQIDIQGGG